MGTDYDQVYDNTWWSVPKTWWLQCCHCGLTHKVRMRVRKGKLELCFTVDHKETRKARRSHESFKRRR